MSNAYLGHQDRNVKRIVRDNAGTVYRRAKDNATTSITLDVPLTAIVKSYNAFVGGVDNSDQLISYHRVIRQMKQYWKTLLYHLIEIAVTKAAANEAWRKNNYREPF